MKKAYSVVLSVLMCMSLVVFNAGCSASSTTKIINVVIAEAQVAAQAAKAFSDMKSDPKFGQFFAEVANLASVDLPIILSAAQAWTAAKSAGKLAALEAAVNSFAASVNAEVLAANRVANTDSEKKIVGYLELFAVTVNAMSAALAPLTASGSSLPAGFHEVVAMAPQAELNRLAKVYGVPSRVLLRRSFEAKAAA